jgi:hypothetical protein
MSSSIRQLFDYLTCEIYKSMGTKRCRKRLMLSTLRARKSNMLYAAFALLACLWLYSKAIMSNRRSGAMQTHLILSDGLPTLTAPRSCDVPLCIIAHGFAANDAIGRLHLERYLAKHPAVPALVLLQQPGTDAPILKAYNTGPQSRHIHALLHKNVLRTHGSTNSMLNAMHAIAILHLRACSIWEMDTNVTLLSKECVSSQISRSLRPSEPGVSITTPFHVGVRPRGTSGSSESSDAAVHLPVVNAYTLLSPTAYYAPRGFPEELIWDDERGRGAHAPELVRIGLLLPEAKSVIVIQSSIDGAPDAMERFLPDPDQPIRHGSFVPALVLPSGVLHP